MFKNAFFIITVIGLLAFIGYQENEIIDQKNKLLEKNRIYYKLYYNALNRMTREELLTHLSCLQEYLETAEVTKAEEELGLLKELEYTVDSILTYL